MESFSLLDYPDVSMECKGAMVRVIIKHVVKKHNIRANNGNIQSIVGVHIDTNLISDKRSFKIDGQGNSIQSI